MRFDAYAARIELRNGARLAEGENVLAIHRKRVLVGRLVEQAERSLGAPLDLTPQQWPTAVSRLLGMSAADIAALTSPRELAPTTTSKRKE